MSRPGRLFSERGSVIVLAALALLMLLGLSALVVDLGVAYMAAQQAQNAADVAALAGVGKLRDGMDPAAASQEATAVAAANTILRHSVTLSPSDVKVGAWDAVTRQVVDWDPTATSAAVQVTVRRTQGSLDGPVHTLFAGVLGVDHIEVTRSAIAVMYVSLRPRSALNLMIVQDGSTSFQSAWSKAIDADTELLKLINGVSVTSDSAGMVTFSAALPDWYLSQAGLASSYKPYPQANLGIKYTTDSSGKLRKTNVQGVSDSHGLVRSMTGALTEFDPNNHTQLVTALDTASKLLKNGVAWGDTDTAAGLNYAIDRLLESGNPAAEKVIVLISDGMPHDINGSYYTQLRMQAAVDAADRAQSEGIRIHTVTLEGTKGANFDFNESLIRNGGYALRAADADKLRDILISVGKIEVGHPSLVR